MRQEGVEKDMSTSTTCDRDRQRRLQALTIPERISAAARHYEPLDPGFAAGLRHAAEIAGPDGWQHIAPAWADVGDGA